MCASSIFNRSPFETRGFLTISRIPSIKKGGICPSTKWQIRPFNTYTWRFFVCLLTCIATRATLLKRNAYWITWRLPNILAAESSRHHLLKSRRWIAPVADHRKLTVSCWRSRGESGSSASRTTSSSQGFRTPKLICREVAWPSGRGLGGKTSGGVVSFFCASPVLLSSQSSSTNHNLWHKEGRRGRHNYVVTVVNVSLRWAHARPGFCVHVSSTAPQNEILDQYCRRPRLETVLGQNLWIGGAEVLGCLWLPVETLRLRGKQTVKKTNLSRM